MKQNKWFVKFLGIKHNEEVTILSSISPRWVPGASTVIDVSRSGEMRAESLRTKKIMTTGLGAFNLAAWQAESQSHPAAGREKVIECIEI